MRRIDRKKEYVEIPPSSIVSKGSIAETGEEQWTDKTETRSTFEYNRITKKTNPLYVTMHDCKKKNE